MQQLDLFTYRRNSEVVAFPMHRRRSQVLEVATAMLSLSRSSGQRHWRKHCAALRRELQATGFSSVDVATLMEEHTRAVSREMNLRLTYQRMPDDAA